jgi:hypothetical protein
LLCTIVAAVCDNVVRDTANPVAANAGSIAVATVADVLLDVADVLDAAATAGEHLGVTDAREVCSIFERIAMEMRRRLEFCTADGVYVAASLAKCGVAMDVAVDRE